MKIKKTLSSAMIILSVALVLLAATSCDLTHKHSFTEFETVSEPTCTSFGLEKRACECGAVEYDTIDALSHAPVIDAAIGATCTTPGKTEGSHCGRCGAVITVQNPVVSTGHCCNNVTVLEEALCDMDGTKRYSCTNVDCDYYYDESYSLSELSGEEIYAEAMKYTGRLCVIDRLGKNEVNVSAFVIRSDGVIVTSNEALDNGFSASFVLGDEVYEVIEVLAYSELYGVAVLKLDATDLPCADICAKDPVVAETVYSLGVTSIFEQSISRGIISFTECVEEKAVYTYHDADMSEGFYGGPLLNGYGEVIGINVGIFEKDEDVCRAAHISGIDALDYSTPISMEEYGKATYTPVEQLKDWVEEYEIGKSDDLIAYVLQGSNFYYSLGYNTSDDYPMTEGYWNLEGNYQLYVRIIFDNSEGTYNYYATFTDGVRQNETEGFIDAATYTESTILTYDTFYGKYWTESELMALYSDAVYDTLEYFSCCLESYFIDLDLKAFGFNSLSYEKDDEALTKLQNFVMTVGTFEPITGSYVLSVSSQMGEDMISFNIAYHLETGDTVVSAHKSLAGGATYSVYLTLNNSENGNRFDFTHSAYNGEEYVMKNTAWGYLDAGSFTSMAKLHCYEFEGMNEYEDGLLVDYMLLLDYMMKMLNDSVMPGVDPALTVEDLGFYFYFG